MQVKVRKSKKKGKQSNLGTIIGGAVVCAAAAFFVFSRGGATASTAPVSATTQEVMLPVPVTAVAQGESLSEVEFVYVKWQQVESEKQFMSDVAPYRDFITSRRLQAYMPVPTAALKARSAELNQVVERIPEGMRAITVKVDAESAVEGWAQSGSFVDVLVMRKLSENDNSIETKVIAENVKILSAGRSTKATPEMPLPPATVTLLVDQTDALRIKTAVNLGKITFSLRGLGDTEPTVLTQMNQRGLLGSSRIQMPSEEQFKGFATGPDGQRWVLSDGNRWMVKDSKVEPTK